MKRSILLSALVVAGTGVAIINLLPAVHSSSASQAVSTVSVARAAEPAAATPVAVALPSPAAQPDVHKASLDMRQAPVPLLMKPHPPVNLPATEAAPSTETKAEDPKPIDASASSDPAADASAQNVAKAAIEADGYKGVRVVHKGENGVWHATALRGGTMVSLTVDASGSVSTD